MSRRNWTWVTAGVVVLLAGLAIQQAANAPALAFDSFGSATIPYFVAISLLVLVALMVFEELTLGEGLAKPDRGPAETGANAPAPRWSVGSRTALSLAAFIVYVVLLDLTDIPFWVATLIFTYIGSRLLEGGTGRGRIASLVVAALVAVGTQVVFTEFLLIDLP